MFLFWNCSIVKCTIFIGCHFHWAFRTFHRAALTPRLLSPTSLVDKWRFKIFRQPHPRGFSKISTARIASWVIMGLKEESTSCQLYLELHKKKTIGLILKGFVKDSLPGFPIFVPSQGRKVRNSGNQVDQRGSSHLSALSMTPGRSLSPGNHVEAGRWLTFQANQWVGLFFSAGSLLLNLGSSWTNFAPLSPGARTR